MQLKLYYVLNFPIAAAKALMREVGDTGDPETLVIQYPVSDFSHESFDDFMYGSGHMMSDMLTLLQEGKFSEKDFRGIRIYEAVELPNGHKHKELCHLQDFQDVQLFFPGNGGSV